MSKEWLKRIKMLAQNKSEFSEDSQESELFTTHGISSTIKNRSLKQQEGKDRNSELYPPTQGLIKRSKLLQFVRRWRSQCSKSKGKPARLLACSLILPKCATISSIQHSDDEDGNEELNKEDYSLKSSFGLNKQPSTPRGYLAMYVGEERRRFLVKTNSLNHPLFSVLLDKAKEEFGFDQKGPLNIPCDIAFFEHIMMMVESDDPSYRNADHASVLLHFNSDLSLDRSTAAETASTPAPAAEMRYLVATVL